MPPDVTLRAPTLEDAAAVAALLNRVADADEAGWVDEEAIRNWFTNPNLPIAEDAVLAERDGDLVARRDYAPVRYSFEMEIDLDEEPAPPEWPDGISVRTFRDGEERRIHEVDTEAFADHWDFSQTPFDEWRHWNMEDGFDPACWFVAEENGEIAGVSLCRPQREGRPDLGWVATLAVRRPWRRRGIALALLRHSFRELRSRGRERAGLGVDGENTTGAVRLYERAGMRVARRADTYERPSPS